MKFKSIFIDFLNLKSIKYILSKEIDKAEKAFEIFE